MEHGTRNNNFVSDWLILPKNIRKTILYYHLVNKRKRTIKAMIGMLACDIRDNCHNFEDRLEAMITLCQSINRDDLLTNLEDFQNSYNEEAIGRFFREEWNGPCDILFENEIVTLDINILEKYFHLLTCCDIINN
jgi:hypothetical protein